MKHKNIALALLATTLLVSVPVFAETSVGLKAEVRTDIKKEIEQKKTEMKDLRDAKQKEIDIKKGEMEKKRGEIKELRSDFNARTAQNRIRSDIKVFTATASRLDKIVSRIETRIVKIKAAGGNTTEIQTNLDAGKAKLAEARVGISAFSSIDLTSATSSTTVRTLLSTIKENAAKTKDALKSAHESLIKATTLMQGVEKKVKVKGDADSEATSTNKTNN